MPKIVIKPRVQAVVASSSRVPLPSTPTTEIDSALEEEDVDPDADEGQAMDVDQDQASQTEDNPQTGDEDVPGVNVMPAGRPRGRPRGRGRGTLRIITPRAREVAEKEAPMGGGKPFRKIHGEVHIIDGDEFVTEDNPIGDEKIDKFGNLLGGICLFFLFFFF